MENIASRFGRHTWIMLLCCLIPLAAMAAIFVFKVPVSQTLTYGLVLLCPLGHIVMMAFMGGHGHSQHDRPEGPALNSSTERSAKTGSSCH